MNTLEFWIMKIIIQLFFFYLYVNIYLILLIKESIKNLSWFAFPEIQSCTDNMELPSWDIK